MYEDKLQQNKLTFKVEPLKNMAAIGKIEPHQVQLWVRSEKPGELKIKWWPINKPEDQNEKKVIIKDNNQSDNTNSFFIPDSGELQSFTQYEFQVIHSESGNQIGQGVFETAPHELSQCPEQFAIGLISCNQPFNKDGEIIPQANDMLEASRKALHDHNAKMIFMVGDQMYSDLPEPLSLFSEKYFSTIKPSERKTILDCSAEETHHIFQKRYRYFWNIPGWIKLHEEFPCYPILDDHDMVDNWGTNPAHQEPEWQSFEEGARAAYFDYQGSRVRKFGYVPSSFRYEIEYADTSTFVMDIRSNRKNGTNSQLISQSERDAVVKFLEKNIAKKIIFIVLSVPIIHLPKKLVRIISKLPASPEDFSDRWSAIGHIKDRDWFLNTVFNHQQRYPQQKIIFLSGDIHIGCFHQVNWLNDNGILYQLISSGITHLPTQFIQNTSKLLVRMNRKFCTLDRRLNGNVKLVKGVKDYPKNPMSGLNLGIIDLRIKGAQNAFRCSLYSHRGDEPKCVYQSPWIE